MSALAPKTPEQMFERAQGLLDQGVDPDRLLLVAIAHREKWAELAECVDAGEYLDGRASIYTGETYAQARDRWDAYRELLLEHCVNALHRSLS